MEQGVQRQLADQPEKIIELSVTDIFSIPLADQHALQLQAARTRFHELREKIPVVAQMAEEQGISEINSLEDLAALLMPHSALKSYPMQFLENARFDRLTQWLSGFTTIDLSGVDASKCDSIDDWLDLLDAQTDVRVLHSSGTSGKLSFLPRSTIEMKIAARSWGAKLKAFRDEEPALDSPFEETPMLYTSYRHGGMSYHRLLDTIQDEIYGGDASMILASHPGRLSADAASIGGRLRLAEQRGELGRMQISPKLLERRDQFLADQANADEIMDQFLTDITTRFPGRSVAILGALPTVHHLAVEGLKRGYEGVFAPGSYIQLGGGMKGQKLPDDWYETILKFFGATKMTEGYGMTEVVNAQRICPEGHFHLPAWQIPYLFDPASGKPMPRTGTQDGRFGFYDLNSQTYWGGFLTGDAVTFSWGDTEPCGCGRIGPYVHRGIRRYTQAEGGDDKITCAEAPEVHDSAVDFILQKMG